MTIDFNKADSLKKRIIRKLFQEIDFTEVDIHLDTCTIYIYASSQIAGQGAYVSIHKDSQQIAYVRL